MKTERDARASAALPAALADLLRLQGLRVERSLEITALPGRHTTRSAFRLDLVGGRTVKGRVMPAEPMRAWCQWHPHLPAEGFPALLCNAATASLEAWAPGCALRPADPEHLPAAGALLGRVHAVGQPRALPWSDARLQELDERIGRWRDRVLASGQLDAAASRAVPRLLERLRPATATWGLRHGDFARENLVLGPEGLVCIDNVSVREDARELDLAQAIYRWSMAPSERAAFLAGHARYADASNHAASEPFWNLVIALRSLSWRLREGTGQLEQPRRLLDAVLENAA